MVMYSIRNARRVLSGWVTASLLMGPVLRQRTGIEPDAAASWKPRALPQDALGDTPIAGVPGRAAWFGGATHPTVQSRRYAGVTQLAECLLPKQNVAGSNPVSRSTSIFVLSATR